MGSVSTNGKCILTELSAEDVNLLNSNWDGYEYRFLSSTQKPILVLPRDAHLWKDNPQFRSIRHLIAGLLLNDNWPDDGFQPIMDPKGYFEKVLTDRAYPKTPKEKRDFLFLDLLKKQRFDGESRKIYLTNDQSYRYYLRNSKELEFYIGSLVKSNLIKAENERIQFDCRITYEGLNYGMELQESGEHSNNCFVAMSYSNKVTEIRDIIKKACIDTGYNPILVDEIEIDHASTINDAIIANLKKCKFCIADFTEQKDGVYFESGFALGQGKKVIYTCKEDWFEKSHFDTNHFPHIIYSNGSDLAKKLLDRIKAWISP